MLTAPSPPTGTYFAWSTKGPERFTADVLVRGGEVASRSFRRGIPTGIVEQKLSVADDGVYGRYWARRDARAMHSPAVLMFGGADGGLRVGPRGEMLAAHGYSTLAIAYFKEPGLPKTLRSIPLEYFRRALEWLARRPGVDPRRIAVIGVSRGGEAAQLLGVHYPDLVDGVVAASTSNAALCSYPGCSGPAWTLGDEAVPYVNGLPVPETSGEGVIPDERIRGPLFLVCGGRDAIALSCAYERAIMRRLRDSQHPYADQLHAYRRADHYVGGLLPGLPIAPRLYLNAANERAREDLWPKLLTFLAKLPDQEEGGDHAGRRLL